MTEDTVEASNVEPINIREPGARAKAARQQRNRALAQKVMRLMQARGWSASELARRANLNKDVISTTTNGKSYPSQVSLQAMARAFNVPVAELSTEYEEIAVAPSNVSMGVREVAERPGYMLLTINKVVRTSVALKVLNIVGADDVSPAD